MRRRIFLALFVISAASVGSYLGLVQFFSIQEAVQTEKRAIFFANSIDGALRRLWHLPFVISQDALVVDALETESGVALNPVLKDFAERASADQIFLMDLNGKTLAASNYQSEDSFVGNFYTFRPYFSDAISGQTGQLFAIGVTTGEPGYFVSEPVRDGGGNIFGVVVVKIALDGLSQSWQASGERILVTNSDGVVILASKNSDRFSTLEPISTFARREMEGFQLFGDRPLLPLDWQVGTNGRASLAGVDFLLARAQITQEDWTLILLSSLSGIRLRAALAVVVILVVLFGIIIAATSFRSIRLRQALGKSDADRARLSEEVEVRRVAENNLRIARDELARSSRLAALGQLSASITHELGQPISAMRNYLAAEEIAAGAAPGSVNSRLSDLVDRMQNINNQLRFFATPGVEEASVFDLRDATEAACELVRHGMAASNVKQVTRFAKSEVNVLGNQQRVEQVLVNLLRNGVEAASGTSKSRVEIEVGKKAGEAYVRIIDSGAGLEGRTLNDLQEPFMTTKSSGQGMGLGLSISAQIAKDLNGHLEARQGVDGGAQFSFFLPLVEVAK